MRIKAFALLLAAVTGTWGCAGLMQPAENTGPGLKAGTCLSLDPLDGQWWRVRAVADSLPVEKDSLGFEVIRLHGDCFTYHFAHNFRDTTGALETTLTFEVGFETYNTLNDLVQGNKESEWQGYRTGKQRLEDLDRLGYVHPIYGLVRVFDVQFIGLPKGKLIVFSVKASDDWGNGSDWSRSVDTVPWAPECLQRPVYVIREDCHDGSNHGQKQGL